MLREPFFSINTSQLKEVETGVESFMKDDSDARRSPNCQTYFDGRSEAWGGNYAPGGGMVERLTRFVEQLKRRLPDRARILDFGCGTGDIAVRCGREGYQVDAVDASAGMVEAATGRFRAESVVFRFCEDTLKLPYANGTFDGVIASSVVEYIGPLEAQLRELHRVCKAGGHAFITVPNMSHPIRWGEAIERFLVSPVLPRLAGSWREREEYLKLSINRVSRRAWRGTFERAGWTVVAIEHRSTPLAMIVAEKVEERESMRAEALR